MNQFNFKPKAKFEKDNNKEVEETQESDNTNMSFQEHYKSFKMPNEHSTY